MLLENFCLQEIGYFSDPLTAVEKEEVNFREKIEKLREQAGESWLTFYNELQVEEEEDTSQKVKYVLCEKVIISLLIKTYFCPLTVAMALSIF